MKYVEWTEPYSYDPLTIVICRMAIDDVVRVQQEKAKAADHKYESSEHAIEDFIAVRWGKIIEEKDE